MRFGLGPSGADFGEGRDVQARVTLGMLSIMHDK